MTALQSELLKQIEKLPPNRVAEVADFVAFLAAREERQAAAQRLLDDMAKMDALGQPALTEADVEEAVQQARSERKRQRGEDR